MNNVKDDLSVIGVFANPQELQSAVDALERQGFDRAQFGVLTRHAGSPPDASHTRSATDAVMEPESKGAVIGGTIGGLGYVGAMVAIGATVLTGGGLGLAIAALAAGGVGGGLMGALLAAGFHRDHARYVETELQGGGLVLWVKSRSQAEHEQVLTALRRGGAKILEY